MTNEDLYAAILSLKDATEHFATRVETRFNGIDARFDRLDERFDRMDVRMGRLETRIECVETAVGSLRSDIVRIEGRLSR